MTTYPTPYAKDNDRVTVTKWELSPNDGYAPPGESVERPLPPLQIINPADYFGHIIPSRRWIVRDWIPCGVVTGLYGDGGLGKSLLAQQLQSACACGGEWVGQVAEYCRSIGFYCEDDTDELLRRQENITAAMNLEAADLANVQFVSRVHQDNILMTFSKSGKGELTPLHKQMVEQSKDFGARLAVFDTAADFFAGNENDRGQVRQFIAVALGSIAEAIDGAVLLCAHPSRSGISSGTGDGGSTGWSNSFRSRLYLSMPECEGVPPDDERVLARKKANYAARNDQIPLVWSNGAFRVNRPNDAIGSSFRASASEVFLSLLDALTKQNRLVSDNAHASNYAPKEFALQPDRQGYKRQDFKLAMERLFAVGQIKVVEDGPPSRRRRYIANA
ncbi:RecA-family ATPase [Rhodoblastus acidophilus]|uniref:AAA family ATPase n=1 Tax=Rhodoblastus acidophilus TaxID=1074 RepID=UPI00222476D8|nr:AAA family ATPase [Rhodoblastus acidophilus]MCW2286223.1 RecA-family ATPase [Rhodoblastus acidophilus]MCW2335094.1 RecA-family ATPase [Rhodoblastus acidophilus]